MSDASAVESLLFAALKKPTGGERAAFLDSACAGDAELRRQVERLLKAHANVGDFLQKPVVGQLAAAPEPTDATQEIASTDGPGARPADRTGLYLERTECGGASDEGGPLDFLQPSTRPGSLGQLGHYEILQLLGQGGFGIVFRAFDEQLQRVVAIKVLAPDMAANATARKRFLREARVSARVRHENVVQVFAVEEEPLPYLVMEFVPGETLQQRLERVGPLDVTEVVQFGRQIAEGLAAAHQQGLIHRDIKPGNILIESGPDQQARITDFGLARAADDASLTQSGVVAGTPQFMAPEQAGAGTLDHRADLFSLGSVLYTICAGRPPFRAPSTLAVLKRVVEETPRPIREIIPEVPEWLCDLISRLHAKKPEDRIGTAREVADLLGQGLAALQSPGSVEPPSFGPTEVRKAASSEPMTEVVPPIKPRFRSRRWVAAAAVLLALLLLALLGVVRVSQETRPSNAKAAQEGSPTDFTNTLGMKFKLIPAGKFRMGSARGEIDRFRGELANDDNYVSTRLVAEVPEHSVEITQPFYLGVTEVTLGQFRRFVEESGDQRDAQWKHFALKQTDDHPVCRVSWQNASDFCNWLSKKEGEKYRLPTEAEWEYCCRAGKSGTRYCFGDDEAQLEHYAWYKGNSGIATHPVGQKKPNEWGLYDMHGNVWEWCQDWYQATYYQNSPLQDPPGGVGGVHVLRGGSVGDGAVACRSAFRYEHPADVGFRVLLVIHPGGDRIESGAKEKGVVAQTMNPDRRAAEYVLSIGGTGWLNDQFQDIQAAAALPQEPFRFTGVYLRYNKQVSDEGLTNFKGCKNLTLLHLDDTPVSDVGLANFKDCKNLQRLVLANTRVSDVGLAHFKDCKDLTFLVLSGTQVTDAGLAYFKDRNLHNLYLSGTKVTDAGLAHFKDCKNLDELILQNIRMTDAGLAHFKNAQTLRNVHVDGTQITDAGLAQLKQCKNLQLLLVSRTKVTAAGIDELKKALPRCKISWSGPDRRAAEYVLSIGGAVRVNEWDRETKAAADLPRDVSQLTCVNLGQKQMTAAGLAVFKDCLNLRELELQRSNVTDVGLAHFKDGKNLTFLDLTGTQVTDAGLAGFKGCKNLWCLNLSETAITDAGLAHFKDCNNLTELVLSSTRVTGEGLVAFKGCKNLMVLNLRGTQTTDAALAHLKDFKNLTRLSLAESRVTDAGLAAIKDCTSLKFLELKGRAVGSTKVTAAGIDGLKKALPRCRIEWDGGVIEPTAEADRRAAEYVLSIGGTVWVNDQLGKGIGAAADLPRETFRLTHFHLPRSKVTDEGLAHFKGCKNLKVLDLRNTRVTDAGLAHFKDCKDLTYLQVMFTPVSDVGLAHFKDCKDLTFLVLSGTQVTDAGLAYFKDRNLHNLYLSDTKVTDAGLAHFKGCKELRELILQNMQLTDAGLAHFKNARSVYRAHLDGTQITDAGLAQLKECKNLGDLWVSRTKVTAAGFGELKKALPRCRISWDGGIGREQSRP